MIRLVSEFRPNYIKRVLAALFSTHHVLEVDERVVDGDDVSLAVLDGSAENDTANAAETGEQRRGREENEGAVSRQDPRPGGKERSRLEGPRQSCGGHDDGTHPLMPTWTAMMCFATRCKLCEEVCMRCESSVRSADSIGDCVW